MTRENGEIFYHGLIGCDSAETSAESEILLPDYYPPVLKLVRTDAIAHVRSESIRGDRIYVEGTVEFRILYISETDENFQSVFYPVPFSYSSEIKGEINDDIQLHTHARPSYVNVRALSPQKLYAKAVVELTICMVAPVRTRLLDPETLPDLIKRTEQRQISDLTFSTQKILKIQEEIDPGSGLNPAHILRYDTFFEEDEKKLINNKMIVKSEWNVQILFTEAQNPEIHTATAKIPLSQVLELPDGTTDAGSSVFFAVQDCKFSIKEKAQAGAVLVCEAEISVVAECRNDEDVSILTDAYSVSADASCETETVTLLHAQDFSLPFSVEQNFDLEDAQAVLEVIPSCTHTCPCLEGSNAVTETEISCLILYRSFSGELMTCEKKLALALSVPEIGNADAVKTDAEITLRSAEYSLNGRSLSIRVSGLYHGMLTSEQKVLAVRSVSLSERKKDRTSGVVICYATDGEPVWDIAKHYAADPEQIRKQNTLMGETVEGNRILFIER